MPTIEFWLFEDVFGPVKYGHYECQSPWDVFQAINEHVRKGYELSTVEIPADWGSVRTRIAIADPGLEWAKGAGDDGLLIEPKHWQDMEEMEAFSVELWELAVRLTRGATT